MSTPKLACGFGLAGLFGLVAAALIGRTAQTNYFIDAGFVCIAVCGLLMILYVANTLWKDFTQSR